MNFSILALLAATLRMATPLTLAGLGETISEKSGILNIGLEGIMLFGAFFSFLGTYLTGSLLFGIFLGILAGMILSLFHAFLSISCKVDQTIAGLAINFLSLGLSSFIFLKIFGKSTTLPSCATISNLKIPFLSDIPIIGSIFFSHDIVVYLMAIFIVLIWIFLKKTQWGLNLQAVGEYPRAADSVGVSVQKYRYLSSAVNGIFGGLAGGYLVLGQLGFFIENITAGKGYIAIVVVILGRRHPFGVFLASLLIGFASALQYNLQTIGFNIPSQVFAMFPYLITIFVLLLSIGHSSDPAALGKSYVRDER